MQMKLSALFLLSLVAVAAAAHVDLQAKYTFSEVLYNNENEYYELFWNFTKATESIYFAVNVSTTGWVGFGLSPNGMMPGSDVVIGWVNGEQTYFHDRFAEGRYLPSIDESQDWFLINGEEEDGFTVLEFSRNFTTCDTKDLDITSSTSRVVWSFSNTDPTDPNGAGALEHDFKGSRSLNLISGLPNRINFPEDQDFFEVTVANVTIPVASTTYWCETLKLPSLFANRTHYINRFGPVITPHTRSFVHHIIVSICTTTLSDEEVGVSAPCDSLNSTLSSCLSGIPLGGWAVGGEGFIYPEGISYPLGGTGQQQFIVMEMHYDNPNNTPDIIDSSGMRYYYTTEEPKHSSGLLALGHDVNALMIIPPKTANYTIAGICDTSCLDSGIPPEGIKVFGNLLHTHLAGRGLVVEHYRYNSECDVMEELEPIDQNLNYDFNFQQNTLLPKEHVVHQGDILVLKCFYDTATRSNLTTGGLSTQEEMCLSFLEYYPRSTNGDILDVCVNTVNSDTAFTDFYSYLQRSSGQEVADRFANPNTFFPTLMDLDWENNPQNAKELQYSVLNSTSFGICSSPNTPVAYIEAKLPVTKCPYEAPSKCSDVSPKTCCERILADGVAPQMHLSIAIALLMVSLSLLLII